MSIKHGKKIWYFPDGELPPPGNDRLKGHESIIVLNPSGKKAKFEMTLYFCDREPVCGIFFEVIPKRVRCIRMDNKEELGGFEVPVETQYAIRIESDMPIIVQYGRLDTRQMNMAYYTTMGFCP